MDKTFKLDGERMPFSPICTYCRHLDFEKDFSCDAFEYIPDEIWFGKNNHTQPVKGDHGIKFERFEPEDEAKD